MSVPLGTDARRVGETTRRFFSPHAAALAAILALAAALVVPLLRWPLSHDGAVTYLPLARRLLQEGLAFLGSPDSVMVAPLAFIYPALLGASEMAVRWANIGAYLATIAIAYRTLSLVHSRAAGLAVALLLAVSPTLRPFMPNVLTEPPFVFLVALWALSVARVVTSQGSMRLAICLGAAALALASLVRPAALLFAPAMALAMGVRWALRRDARPVEGRLAALHALALIPPLLVILRNYWLFGLASIATGSGAALWLGVDPSVNGFDPVYFGMDYDTGGVTREFSHLSIAGDRLLAGAARMQLADLSPAVLAQMLARKALAFLVMSPVELGVDLPVQRAWRVALLACALPALYWQRRSAFTWLVAAFVAYMVAIHAPAMYHRRYSIGAIDLPLSLLAGIGIVEASRDARRWGAMAAGLILGVGLALVQLAARAPGSPRIDRVPMKLMWHADVHGEFAVGRDARIELPMPVPPENAGDYSATRFRMALTPTGHGSCAAMTARYRRAEEAKFDEERAVRIPIRADGRVRDVTFGTTQPLHIDRPGTMRLDFECNGAATLRIQSILVQAPMRASVYRQRWLDQSAGKTR